MNLTTEQLQEAGITPEVQLEIAKRGAEALGYEYKEINCNFIAVKGKIFDPCTNADDLNALVEHYGINLTVYDWAFPEKKVRSWIADRPLLDVHYAVDISRNLSAIKYLIKVMGIDI